jgi:hypothetical protein
MPLPIRPAAPQIPERALAFRTIVRAAITWNIDVTMLPLNCEKVFSNVGL